MAFLAPMKRGLRGPCVGLLAGGRPREDGPKTDKRAVEVLARSGAVQYWPDACVTASQSATDAIKYIRKYDNRVRAASSDIIAEFDDLDSSLPPLNPADMSVRAPHFLGEFALGKPSANSLFDKNLRQNVVFRAKNHVRQSFASNYYASRRAATNQAHPARRRT